MFGSFVYRPDIHYSAMVLDRIHLVEIDPRHGVKLLPRVCRLHCQGSLCHPCLGYCHLCRAILHVNDSMGVGIQSLLSNSLSTIGADGSIRC